MAAVSVVGVWSHGTATLGIICDVAHEFRHMCMIHRTEWHTSEQMVSGWNLARLKLTWRSNICTVQGINFEVGCWVLFSFTVVCLWCLWKYADKRKWRGWHFYMFTKKRYNSVTGVWERGKKCSTSSSVLLKSQWRMNNLQGISQGLLYQRDKAGQD